MNKKQIVCDNCKLCFDKPLIHKDKDGRNYCFDCKARFLGVPPDQRPLNREDFDKLLKSLWLTPPTYIERPKRTIEKGAREKEETKKGLQKQKKLRC